MARIAEPDGEKSKKSKTKVAPAGGASLALATLRLALEIQRRRQSALNGMGIHASGIDVLELLRRDAAAGGAPMAALAKELGVTPASLTNRIDQLTSKGWVERKPSPSDKRIFFAAITPAGLKLLESADPTIANLEAKLFDGLKKGERKDLAKLLRKALESLQSPGAVEA